MLLKRKEEEEKKKKKKKNRVTHLNSSADVFNVLFKGKLYCHKKIDWKPGPRCSTLNEALS